MKIWVRYLNAYLTLRLSVLARRQTRYNNLTYIWPDKQLPTHKHKPRVRKAKAVIELTQPTATHESKI